MNRPRFDERSLKYLLSVMFLFSAVFHSFGLTEADQIKTVLSLMKDAGGVLQQLERFPTPELKIVDIKTTNGIVNIEFSTQSNEIQSVTRTVRDSSDKVLSWNREKVVQAANGYLMRLMTNKEMKLGDPILVSQHNLDGSRNLWEVGWARKVQGYIVRDDFVNITLNEDEGLFGFAYSWNTQLPKNIPAIPLEKSEAIQIAKTVAREVRRTHLRQGQVNSRIISRRRASGRDRSIVATASVAAPR